MSAHTPGRDPILARVALGAGLTDKQLALHPGCSVCGWRKGGIDSWDGARCKCGHHSLPFGELFKVAREADAAIKKATEA